MVNWTLLLRGCALTHGFEIHQPDHWFMAIINCATQKLPSPIFFFLLACRILQKTLHTYTSGTMEGVPRQSNPQLDQSLCPCWVHRTLLMTTLRQLCWSLPCGCGPRYYIFHYSKPSFRYLFPLWFFTKGKRYGVFCNLEVCLFSGRRLLEFDQGL